MTLLVYIIEPKKLKLLLVLFSVSFISPTILPNFLEWSSYSLFMTLLIAGIIARQHWHVSGVCFLQQTNVKLGEH